MPSIINVTQETLSCDVYNAGNFVLLDLWAPWCAPCRALAPALEKLANICGDGLQIAKLDVEKYPDAMSQFGVRGIPALLLFKDGHEIGRELGSKTLGQLTEWMKKANVQLALQATPPIDAPLFGAFYGDSGLKAYLCDRLLAHAGKGELQVSRAPFWSDGKGTTAAALVHSADLQVFERITGLPGALSSALDFVQVTDSPALEPLCTALRPGTDLSRVPAQLMYAFFQEPSFDWPGLLAQSPTLDGLRDHWLALCQQYLDGQPVSQTLSTSISSQAKSLLDNEDQAVSQVAKLIDALTPLPHANDSDTWSSVFSSASGILFPLGQHHSGWTLEDRNMEKYRFQWFTQKQTQSATGTFSDEELSACREQWMNEQAAYQHKEDEFTQNQLQGLDPIRKCLRAHLSVLLNRAPKFLSI